MRTLLLLATLLHLAAAVPASAQTTPRPNGSNAASYWGVNVGAALAAALLQSRDQPFDPVRILAAGIAGGSLIYAGQHVVGLRHRRLQLPGLQLAALGASITGNLARDRQPLSELTLPFFPLYVRLRTEPEPSVDVRLSAVGLVSVARMALTYERGPDFVQSLTRGAAVFTHPAERLQCRLYVGSCCMEEVAGQHLFGAVAYATQGEACLTHEFGHVAQDVRDAVLFAIPSSDYLLSRSRAGRWLARYVVLDAALPLMLLNHTVGERSARCSERSFYECEVQRLTR